MKGFRRWRGYNLLTVSRPDLQGYCSITKDSKNRIGVNKIPPNIDKLFAATIVAVRLFKGVTARPLYRAFGVKGLILSSYLGLGLASVLFPSGFPTNTLYTPLLSSIRATFPAHLILDFIPRTILGEQYRALESSLCNFLYSPVI